MTADEDKIRGILSKNLKKYRALKGFSQERLAESAGISAQTVNDIEGCRKWVSDKTMARLARALSVEVYQLLFPLAEQDKLYPVRLPADVMRELHETIKSDLARRFSEVVTD
ncbi:MAG: helix-turn-helix transcriptional regulator [Spirochaetaceae bacterium]|jgi:transcriptional regulator with XRE-family HTH domain|nr:helix-turn-helix transcriptional regulator [Spirochaetaceae bacterium]